LISKLVAGLWWTGANDLDTEKSFVWEGTGDAVVNAFAWTCDNPDNTGGDEDCGYLVSLPVEKFHPYWIVNDAPCDNVISSICELTL
jgi:hypothetical protein